MFNKYKRNQIIRCCKACKLTKFPHVTTTHKIIENRPARTNSSPSIKSPPIKALKPRYVKHKSSNPMILNASSTSPVSEMNKTVSIKPTLSKSKSLKLVNVNIHKNIQIVGKQRVHVPPQEHGYDNDDEDSLDDDENEIDDDVPKSPSFLDISAPNIAKFIKVAPSKQACRRSRSYAVGLKNEWNLSIPPYCTVTDDDDDEYATTDFDVFSGSSGDHRDSPFRKKAKIIKNTCSFRQYKNDNLWL